MSTITREGRGASTSVSATAVTWTPPVQGMLKCNVDAVIFREQNFFGVGMCLRDDKGNFIRAQTTWNHDNPLPQEAEVWGLKMVISWLQDLGFSNVVIELDCKLVVDGIRGKLNFLTEFGTMLFACKASLSSLSNVRIRFIRRQANNIAHLLARASLSLIVAKIFVTFHLVLKLCC
jgi:ribonuclease HI